MDIHHCSPTTVMNYHHHHFNSHQQQQLGHHGPHQQQHAIVFQQHDQQVNLISSTVPDSPQSLLLVDDACVKSELPPIGQHQFDHHQHQMTHPTALKQIQISTHQLDQSQNYYQDLESENRMSFKQEQQTHVRANSHQPPPAQHSNYSNSTLNNDDIQTDIWTHDCNQTSLFDYNHVSKCQSGCRHC
jgi:ABC-type Fe2+-enterobactin transport system substrate-binding protein